MKQILKNVALYLILPLALGAGLVLGWIAYYATSTLTTMPTPLQFSLKTGSSLKGVAQQMAAAGVLAAPERFVLLARLLGEAANIKAGNYEIDGPVTPLELLRKITEGDYTQHTVTLIEGWTFRQVRRALDEHPALRHDTAGLDTAEILSRLGVDSASPEGWFFPDTYHFSGDGSDFDILRRAHQLMRAHLAAYWEKRTPGLPLVSPYEALILASIIEKETGAFSDRTMVAAVFVNRLRIGMRLQADPTVIYGMGDAFDGNLRKRDLGTDTPHNTYTRAGLPPTPIAMPGLASLAAALNPAPSDVMYFVARGDGTSHFSRTLGEHERAVTKYQRSGRR